MHDSTTGAVLRTIPFFDANYAPIALQALPDFDGNGVAELAVLGVHGGTGEVRVEVRDASTGALLGSVAFAQDTVPRALAVVPDLSGNSVPELAVLGVHGPSGEVRVEVRDASTGLLVQTVVFVNDFTPRALAVVPEMNGDSSAALAVLGVRGSTGQVQVQLQDASTGALLRTIGLTSSPYEPQTFMVMPDLNGNSAAELTVLIADRSSGKVQVQMKDAATGLLVRNVGFSSDYIPRGLVVMPDLNSNGRVELAVLGMHKSTGEVSVQVKDAFTGTLVQNKV